MKAHAVAPAVAGADRLVGWVLCHDVVDPAGGPPLRKGEVLGAASARRLATLGAGEVHLLEPEAGDLHEEPAGQRLALAVAGDGLAIRSGAGGQWALSATRRGLLRVRVEALAAVNALEGVSIYTAYDGQVVDVGEVVARAKVTPLLVPETTVAEAERRARAAGGLVEVRGFRPITVGALAPASLAPRSRARFEAALREKLAWFGAPLARLEFAAADPVSTTAALTTCLAESGLVVAAGANALDPLDAVFAAVERVGGRLLRRGAPAHPGSLLWVAERAGVLILGMPSCGMFSQATLVDLLLARVLAGDRITPDDLARLGHGGLLTRDMAFRFPPYRAGQERGAVPE
jgi:hypothetical protein